MHNVGKLISETRFSRRGPLLTSRPRFPTCKLERKDLIASAILFSRTFSPSPAKLLIRSFSNYTARPRSLCRSFKPSTSFPSCPLPLPPVGAPLRSFFHRRSLSALCKRKYSIRMLNSITAFLINPKYPFLKERRLPSIPSLHRERLRTSWISFGLSPFLSWITVANDMTPLKSADPDPAADRLRAYTSPEIIVAQCGNYRVVSLVRRLLLIGIERQTQKGDWSVERCWRTNDANIRKLACLLSVNERIMRVSGYATAAQGKLNRYGDCSGLYTRYVV